MRSVTRLLRATGALVAIAAAVGFSTPAQAGRMGGGFHGGIGFHGGFNHGGFQRHLRFSPRFGFGVGALYYVWPGYYYDDYPSPVAYPYPVPNPYPVPVPYPDPYYGSGPAVPYASGYGGAYQYPTQTLDFRLGPPVQPAPQVEARPPASQTTPPEPLFGLTRRPAKPASPDTAVDPRLPDVRLTGIVIERDRRMAIFDVTGTRPVVLSEGEALKDWRLDNISPEMVSLSGPAGTGTMTLALNADTNLVRQPPPAVPADPQGDMMPPMR